MVTIEGLESLKARLNAVAKVGDAEFMAELGESIAGTAGAYAPRDSGDLQDSIRVGQVQPREVEVLAGGGKVQYAAAQEFGAQPHLIEARRARLLRFYWAKRGRMFVGPRVNHPGNPPHPYFFKASSIHTVVLKLKAETINLWNRAA